MKLILNTKKIKNELKRQKKSQVWLAQQLGTSRQNLHHALKTKSITQASKIAKVLDFEPKDLLTYEQDSLCQKETHE